MIFNIDFKRPKYVSNDVINSVVILIDYSFIHLSISVFINSYASNMNMSRVIY